ncbi:ferredoxin oxidoreductase [Gammaproteobacteria bacterium 45_16_T64]|nr:ferredoxin oxidoreductase [Gammaproteobacteria bacterium 45_16_T64]
MRVVQEVNSNSKLNEFVIKFANVNGTGSASANHLFAKSIFRMGVPVSPRNIFPSNIQGLPTWYEVRVSEKGYLGRKEIVDIMVAMNPQSFQSDVDSVEPGGYLLYDSTMPLDLSKYREDIHWIGIPITEICIREFSNPKQRQLFKNIVYVGALVALLKMNFSIVKNLVKDQFSGKEKLITPNVFALELGYQWVKENVSVPFSIRVEQSNKLDNKILVDGNTAAGLGCVYGGATVAAWYPITPSTSLVESYDKYCERLRIDPGSGKKKFAIVQAEDELAALGMVIGASWNGARAFTATSGPGVSLMTEFLGLAYFAEVPVVLFNVQRGGPSTGMPTRTQQSDLLACAYASHGDTKHILLFPANPTECFELAVAAFDIAERFQTPVITLSDLELGMNDWTTDKLEWDDEEQYDRGKVLSKDDLDSLDNWGRYNDVDGDGIGYRTYPGVHPDKGAFLIRGTSHDAFARYSERGDDYVEGMERLQRKFATAAAALPVPVIRSARQQSLYGVIYYGTTDPAMDEALDLLAEKDIELDAMRIRAFPFREAVFAFMEHHTRVFVVEQNRDGQMRTLLINEGDINPAKLTSVCHFDGTPITAQFIADSISLSLEELIPSVQPSKSRVSKKGA